MPYKDKEKDKEWHRKRMKARRNDVTPDVTPSGVGVTKSVTPGVVTPVTPSRSGVFVPLEPCYADLLEQEYKKYGGLAEHIGKLLIAKAKEVDRRVAEHRPAVVPIDPMTFQS